MPLNGIFAREEDNSATYMLKNGHGDVVYLLTQTRTTQEYDYDPYGNPSYYYDYSATDTNPVRYSGEYYDSESGLIYLRNRYYDPNTGRFISEDPIQDGMNWYVYCGGNPIVFVDPWGLRTVIAVAGADAASNNNGFLDNIATFKMDNPEDTVFVIKAWDYTNEKTLMSEIIGESYNLGGIDVLLVESHATHEGLYVSTYALTSSASWEKIKFNDNANIKFTGCNAGGYYGEIYNSSIAQYVANVTNQTVWAHLNKTTQIGYDEYGYVVPQGTLAYKYYQVPIRNNYGEKVVTNYTKFESYGKKH